MLRCRDGSLYPGYTTDLARRMKAHREGTASKYTRSRRPVRLVHVERWSTLSEALRREQALKRLSHAGKQAVITRRRMP